MRSRRRQFYSAILCSYCFAQLVKLKEERVELPSSFAVDARQSLVKNCIHVATNVHEEISGERHALKLDQHQVCKSSSGRKPSYQGARVYASRTSRAMGMIRRSLTRVTVIRQWDIDVFGSGTDRGNVGQWIRDLRLGDAMATGLNRSHRCRQSFTCVMYWAFGGDSRWFVTGFVSRDKPAPAIAHFELVWRRWVGYVMSDTNAHTLLRTVEQDVGHSDMQPPVAVMPLHYAESPPKSPGRLLDVL